MTMTARYLKVDVRNWKALQKKVFPSIRYLDIDVRSSDENPTFPNLGWDKLGEALDEYFGKPEHAINWCCGDSSVRTPTGLRNFFKTETDFWVFRNPVVVWNCCTFTGKFETYSYQLSVNCFFYILPSHQPTLFLLA